MKQAEKSCPVCSRPIKYMSPQKGDLAYEETYCSKYCRLFDAQNLELVPFDGGSPYHNGQKRWPRITINCEMCDNETMLIWDIEKNNRSYCSTKCWNDLKTSQKRGIHLTINMLSLLHHRRKYHGQGWMSPIDIAEICGRKGQMCSPTSVGLHMKRWRKAGIIESRLRGGSQHGHEYRFNLKGLRGMTVPKFIHHYNTMSYAERVAFTED